MVSVHQKAVLKFEARVQQLAGTVLRLLALESNHMNEPEQLHSFHDLLADGLNVVQARVYG